MTDLASPYAGTSPVASPGAPQGAVTLVESQTFCLSGRTGDVAAGFPHGLFVLDTRVLSLWELRLNDHGLEPLAVQPDGPYGATFLGHGAPAEGRADADVVVLRHRHVGNGMRERIEVTNHGMEAVDLAVQLRCDVDFADLFEVKENHLRHRARTRDATTTELRFGHDTGVVHKGVVVRLSTPADAEPGQARWHVRLEPGSTWELCLQVCVDLDGRTVQPRFTCGEPDEEALPTRRLATWRARLPRITTDDPRLAQAIARAGEDLGALRIFDPDHPELPILAAGAPWFMTVFGRDSLLTAYQTMVADTGLARGVLQVLARFQGQQVDHEREEEPGKILHEMRFGAASGLAFAGGSTYFGSIDATPLFVVLLGELHRWDPADPVIERLLPHADRAIAWMEAHGDRDGDGYLEYERHTTWGLANQGWKDSWDAIRHAGGDLATTPIALAEVQGYAYAAYVARAEIAAHRGDEATRARCTERAARLRARFDRDFWLEDRGWYALALDGDKRPVDALASNIGHCLWTGIAATGRIAALAEHLTSPALHSGFGVRTLATTMAAYNPVSYHNGSVWPHDNAICAAGLARCGQIEAAHAVIDAQLDVAAHHGGRLPELFAGFGRDQLAQPAPYPTSCSPQAWAAAAPLLWLRTLLGLHPDVPAGVLHLDPHLPEGVHRLHVRGIRIAEHVVDVEVEGDEVAVTGAGDLEVRSGRAPVG